MTFHDYSDSEQGTLTRAIRAAACRHQDTSLFLWLVALERVDPELLPTPPYCSEHDLLDVYDLLDMAPDGAL